MLLWLIDRQRPHFVQHNKVGQTSTIEVHTFDNDIFIYFLVNAVSLTHAVDSLGTLLH